MADGPYKTLIEFFDHASERLKYPKFVCYTASEQVIRLQRSGLSSRYKGALNITDNEPYGENTWYGRIHRNGEFERSRNMPHCHNDDSWNNRLDEIQVLLQQFAADPPAFAAIQGKRYNFCCFCNSELTNPGSIYWGYGPICAGNYGLPWTNNEPTDARDERVANELEESITMQSLNFGPKMEAPTPTTIDSLVGKEATATIEYKDGAEPIVKNLQFTETPVPSNDDLLTKATQSFIVNLRERIETAYNNKELRMELQRLILREWETPDTLVDAIHNVTLKHVLNELDNS